MDSYIIAQKKSTANESPACNKPHMTRQLSSMLSWLKKTYAFFAVWKMETQWHDH
jgi:hypothetical protein